MRRTLPVLVPTLLLGASLLAGCGSEPDADPSAVSGGEVTAPASVPGEPTPTGRRLTAAPTTSATRPPQDTPGPAPERSDAAAPAAAGSPRAGSAPAVRAASPQAAPARSAAPARPAAARGTAPGDYVYDVRGTVTLGAGNAQSREGSATLSVDPVEGDRQSAVLSGEQGRTETDSVLRSDGRYLARLQLTTPAFSKEFRPASPVLLLPTPLEVGRTWTFTMKSTDGKTTATAKNKVLRAEKVTVGGTAVDTRVVEVVLTLRGDVTYDGTTLSNYAPEQRVSVRDRGKGKGTVSGVPFASESTSMLRSLEPS